MRSTPQRDNCPTCGGCDGFLNVGRVHWAVCHKHRVRWRYGENLFSGWRDDPPESHAMNLLTLAQYRNVTKGGAA